MIRSEHARIDAKRRSALDPSKRQFAQPIFQNHDYKHRLNFYIIPPTEQITLEEFEEWAISRLKGKKSLLLISSFRYSSHCCKTNWKYVVLSELETCAFRNRTPEETATYMAPLLEKHLPLHSNSSRSSALQDERRKDHYSHFILRLAFSATEDLRRRFSRLETMLFRLRYKMDDARERQDFVTSLDFAWEMISEKE